MSFAATLVRVAVAAVAVELRGVARRAWRGWKGGATPAAPSQPWTYNDVRHVDDMSDAGATNHRISTDTQRLPRLTQMRPPPLKRHR